MAFTLDMWLIILSTCSTRRKGKAVYKSSKMLTDRATAEQQQIATVDTLDLEAIIASAINEAHFIDGGIVNFAVRFKLPDEWLSFELRDIVREVLNLIQEHDTGYVFSTSRVNLGVNDSKASFVAYCSLSTIQERTRRSPGESLLSP